MHSPDTNVPASARRSSRILWLILAACAAPIAASYVAYYFWQPEDHVNYGELIEPRQLPDTGLTRTDGRRFALQELAGQWTLLAAAPAACDDECRKKLIYMRQVRLAQGKETERVERVWLLTDNATPDATLLTEHPGLIVVRAAEPIVSALPAPNTPADHVYVIDPLGNLMMRFPANPDPRRMLKDLSRLLRHSKWS